MESAISGGVIFDTSSGGINIVKAMDDFYAAMQNQDVGNIHKAVETMQKAMDQVLSAQVRSGMLMARAKDSDALRDEMKAALEEERARVGSVDPVVSVSELSQSHIALQLAMSQLQRMMQTLEQ
jgi:flagellin-like hook-associated protein FlgL